MYNLVDTVNRRLIWLKKGLSCHVVRHEDLVILTGYINCESLDLSISIDVAALVMTLRGLYSRKVHVPHVKDANRIVFILLTPKLC